MMLLALLLAAIAGLFGCQHVGGPSQPNDAPQPEDVACEDCRTVASGNAFQDGDTAIGVGRCDASSCRVVIANPDGTETGLEVAAGDTIDAGSGWTVVATDADGLTVRPAS